MQVIQKKDAVILQDCPDFVPEHIFECGQCFRFYKQEDNSYAIVAKNKVINVSKNENDVILRNTNITDYETIWKNYFDLDTDYSKIKKALKPMDEHLNVACDFGSGMRILNQDFHENVISFIISARNSITSIKKCVLFLSEHLGEKLQSLDGVTYYAFPTLEALANADMEVLKASKAAFRAPYIKKVAQKMLDDNMTYDDFKNLNLDETAQLLQTLPGVGPKVADCIALFSLNKSDAFPVDVWVKRVMEEFYVKEQNYSLKNMRTYGINHFGALAGYAQQYLFYYARQNGLGKKKNLTKEL